MPNVNFEKTENKPGYVILDVGTSDLTSHNNAERIAKSMVDLAKKILSKITALLAYQALYLQITVSTLKLKEQMLLKSIQSNVGIHLMDTIPGPSALKSTLTTANCG